MRGMIFVFFAILFFGCISQTYEHSFNSDGSSTLKQKTDFSKNTTSSFASFPLGERNITELLDTACMLSKVGCKSDSSTITFEKNYSASEAQSYYKFERKEGIVGIAYTATIQKVPTEDFFPFYDEAGKSNKSILPGEITVQKPESIDLGNKNKNREALAELNFTEKLHYIVKMPVNVKKASAGGYNAVINGKTATFDFLEVLKDSAPLVIEAEELNIRILTILGVIAVILIITFIFVKNIRK